MTYRHGRQVQLCRMSGESATPGGARQRDCTQIAQEVTKASHPAAVDPKGQQQRAARGSYSPFIRSPTGVCVHERARLLLPATVRPVPYRNRCVLLLVVTKAYARASPAQLDPCTADVVGASCAHRMHSDQQDCRATVMTGSSCNSSASPVFL